MRELSIIVNYYKGKRDALEGDYRELELTNYILKIVERAMQKLVKQRKGIDKMHFCFMPGCGVTTPIFILRQLQEKYLAKEKNLYFAFLHLEKAFD